LQSLGILLSIVAFPICGSSLLNNQEFLSVQILQHINIMISIINDSLIAEGEDDFVWVERVKIGRCHNFKVQLLFYVHSEKKKHGG
jgi:hypothetical protein